ncbi:hypothetical protein HPB50_003877 [Hyalomma asiaticum]|uniref:Uncharacterized protein n=1 Tax=Hyalomma asiaticum TaxID=266040 RepID=A0ACB7RRM9_HYAAI|nr:hypothetical protein HPB50_003877 [Hyalomma asiaticum]
MLDVGLEFADCCLEERWISSSRRAERTHCLVLWDVLRSWYPSKYLSAVQENVVGASVIKLVGDADHKYQGAGASAENDEERCGLRAAARGFQTPWWIA